MLGTFPRSWSKPEAVICIFKWPLKLNFIPCAYQNFLFIVLRDLWWFIVSELFILVFIRCSISGGVKLLFQNHSLRFFVSTLEHLSLRTVFPLCRHTQTHTHTHTHRRFSFYPPGGKCRITEAKPYRTKCSVLLGETVQCEMLDDSNHTTTAGWCRREEKMLYPSSGVFGLKMIHLRRGWSTGGQLSLLVVWRD